MDNIIGPMIDLLVEALMPIFEWAIEFLGELIMIVLADLLFNLLTIVLSFVKFLSNTFFIFAGVYNVASRQADGTYEADTFLIQALISEDAIMNTYWVLTFLSAALAMVFTIIAVVRSMSDLDYDPKKSVGRILGRCGKTMLTFLIIPSVMVFGIQLATIASGGLVSAFTGGEGALSVDNIIFLTTTMNAAKDGSKNGTNAKFDDSLRKPYLDGEKDYAKPQGTSYAIANDFELSKLDFLTGFILAGFMIFVLFAASLFAVRRILEVLLLYISAPFFVAVMPLDDGKKFEAWRDLFVAKLVSCYGLILMMAMYMAAAPMIMGSGLVLSSNSLTNALMKTLLLIGGAFAVKNGHSIALGILSPTAAQHAQASVGAGLGMMVAGGALGARLAGSLKGKAGGGGKGRQGQQGQQGQQGAGGGQSAAEKTQAEAAQWQNPAEQQQKFNG
jgi:hypothetical protein